MVVEAAAVTGVVSRTNSVAGEMRAHYCSRAYLCTSSGGKYCNNSDLKSTIIANKYELERVRDCVISHHCH